MTIVPWAVLYVCALSALSVASPPFRVTCIGDSITEGSRTSPCGSLSYVTLLQERLGKDMYSVLNAGNSSKTMSRSGKCNPKSKKRMQKICSYWNTHSWNKAFRSLPDVVTIMLGTNDAKSFNWFGADGKEKNTYVEDFKFMLARLMNLPTSPHIAVMTPPPVKQNKFKIDPHIVRDVLPDILRQLVSNITTTKNVLTGRSAAVVLVDIHAHFATYNDLPIGHNDTTALTQQVPPLVCPEDGVHLTLAGSKLVADILFEVVHKLTSN